MSTLLSIPLVTLTTEYDCCKQHTGMKEKSEGHLGELHLSHDAGAISVSEGLFQGVQGQDAVTASIADHAHLTHFQPGHGSTDQGDCFQSE